MRLSSNKLIYAKLFILFIILFYSCNLDFMPGEESTCLSLNRRGQTAWGQHSALHSTPLSQPPPVLASMMSSVKRSQNIKQPVGLHQWTLMEEPEGEEGREVRAISVSLEIKRFQEEINKVQAENCQFYQWKLRRVASRPSVAPSLPPRGISSARSQESILAPPPGRPPKKNNKKVSYCDAVTVFGSSESLGRSADITKFAFLRFHKSTDYLVFCYWGKPKSTQN